MANFVDITPLRIIRSVSDLQNPTRVTHTHSRSVITAGAARTEAPDSARHMCNNVNILPDHYPTITLLCEGGSWILKYKPLTRYMYARPGVELRFRFSQPAHAGCSTS